MVEEACNTCEHVEFKETTSSGIPYGNCKLLDLALIALQFECEYYEVKDEHQST